MPERKRFFFVLMSSLNPLTCSIEQKRKRKYHYWQLSILKRKRNFQLKVSQNFWSLILNSAKSDKIPSHFVTGFSSSIFLLQLNKEQQLSLGTIQFPNAQLCCRQLQESWSWGRSASYLFHTWLIKSSHSCCPLKSEAQ